MVRADQRRPDLQDRGRQVRRRRRRHRRALRDRASRCSSARSPWRSPRTSRACSTSGASPTRCSTPSSTPGRPRSSPRPAGSARSRWPPTWPVAASTSSSAATPRAWPARGAAGGPRAETLVEEFDLPAPLDEMPEEYRRPGRWPRPATTSCSQQFADECKAEGDKVRELGGLYVLGTERHECRRIDNQLRGRSGRQGDPGREPLLP